MKGECYSLYSVIHGYNNAIPQPHWNHLPTLIQISFLTTKVSTVEPTDPYVHNRTHRHLTGVSTLGNTAVKSVWYVIQSVLLHEPSGFILNRDKVLEPISTIPHFLPLPPDQEFSSFIFPNPTSQFQKIFAPFCGTTSPRSYDTNPFLRFQNWRKIPQDISRLQQQKFNVSKQNGFPSIFNNLLLQN